MTKKTFAKIALIIWVFIWALFLVRPYFKSNLIKEYSVLLRLSPEGKRAYVTGRELYDFINFSKNVMAPASTYRIIGLENRQLDERRAVYYLYPNVEGAKEQFLLVFGVKDFSAPGYVNFKTLDPERYILEKVR